MVENQDTPGVNTFATWFDRQGLSMSAFAAKSGTNRVSIKHWLRGEAFPRDEYCEKLHAITGLDCFGPGREAARAEHERLIPPQVKNDRKAKYVANAALFRKRSRDSWRKSYEGQRQFVTPAAELDALRADPRKRKNVCRECGEILRDVGRHLWPAHKLTAAEYKEKWGFLRSRNATRSESTNKKQSAVMKRKKHRPPKWTHERLADAVRASVRTNKKGTGRLEKRLNARGKRLGARPQYWKRTRAGDVVTDARVAQMRLASKSVPEIAVATEMTATPVFFRLKRMGYPKRARVFLHGEPVGWKHFHDLRSDFNLTNEQAAQRLGVSIDWTRRRLKPKRKGEALSLKLAKRLLKVRAELLAEFKKKPASRQGGRPKPLAPSEEAGLRTKYDRLHQELRALRDWIREQQPAPSVSATWDWLCDGFRARTLQALQLWPQFFRYIEKNYDSRDFNQGQWIPRDLAIAFLAEDFGLTEPSLAFILTHRSNRLHNFGAIDPQLQKA